jgi:endonuclease IV
MYSAGVEAIELQLPEHDERVLGDSLRRQIGKFTYRSVHASQLVSPEASSKEVAYYQRIARELGAHAIVVHPDSMTSWGWLETALGTLVQPENMDNSKKFGREADQMQKIFGELPANRKMTFDLNHLYTIDSSMSSLADFIASDMPKVGHYHISGVEGLGADEAPHMPLHLVGTEQQSAIIKSITDHNAPIIIESYGWRDIDQWQQEFRWVTSQLA